MKSTKIKLILPGFLAGLATGILFMVTSSFTSTSSPGSGAGVVPVSVTQANGYFKNYMAGAASFNQVIKGFMVDRYQLEAMNTLVSENSGLAGFRIYFGKDAAGKKIGIVTGIDGNGRDAVSNTIYTTDSQGTNPCPPLCDVTSPIIQN
jgi:hypothetical protein